tara:strand:+ start:1402 stop:1542 length:141 start_codon:yes stop_codon:yes gene_type:complete
MIKSKTIKSNRREYNMYGMKKKKKVVKPKMKKKVMKKGMRKKGYKK